MVEEKLPNAHIKFDDFLQTRICRGNARYSYSSTDGQIIVEDTVNASYGIYDHHDNDVVTIIAESDQYPVKIQKRVATTSPNQSNIEIVPMIKKGSKYEPIIKDGSAIYYRMTVKPSPAHHDLRRITVTYEFDQSQRLKIRAFDNHFKEEVGVEEINLSEVS